MQPMLILFEIELHTLKSPDIEMMKSDSDDSFARGSHGY
jgi:hypothetical protein